MKIVTFDHIIEINKLLKDYNIKLSLKDACGKQSMEIKKIENDLKEINEVVYKLIKDKFKEFNINIEYSINKKYITIV